MSRREKNVSRETLINTDNILPLRALRKEIFLDTDFYFGFTCAVLQNR
jgi:hypothetical protein